MRELPPLAPVAEPGSRRPRVPRRRAHWHTVQMSCLPVLLAALATAGKAQSGPKQPPAPPTLDPAIQRQLDDLLGIPHTDPRVPEQRTAIWRACAIRHGDYDELFADLQQRLTAAPSRPATLRILRTRAHFLRQLGDLDEARRVLEQIKPEEESIADTLAVAEVLDALGRDAPALQAYDRLLKKPIAPELRNRVLLRKALMDTGEKKRPAAPARPAAAAARRAAAAGRRNPAAAAKAAAPEAAAGTGDKPEEGSALARFAQQPDLAPELKNQAAVVLALTDEQKQAIRIFTPSGDGTPRFRQEIRLAEWALEAGEHAAAQEHAWTAVQNSKLKRDRRYSLSLLVEAYRRQSKLDDLIARFAATAELDVESREVWIDLLRERGKVEEALRLFRTAHDGRFTVDMRRELLEICREANDEATLEDAYRKLIQEEPRFLEWREGLARFYLERGRRADAVAVWQPYLQVTEDERYRMAAAGTLMGLGLDDLAIDFAKACMAPRSDGSARDPANALMFLFELHLDRGRHEAAARTLEELDRRAAPGAGVRKDMADAWARLGDKARAVALLQKLYATLGDRTTPDTRMKLALMLSEIGKEDEALEHWTSLWRQIDSVPRRRYVEERLMTVASRIGKLAKLAVDLERKLIAGTADDREAGLLVRLYIRVKDPVSATEVIQEHMGKAGKRPVEVLTEKARVFQSCEDYYNYEKVVQELIAADPEGRADYLRQLAMSNMERGARKEAREVLAQLKSTETDGISDEFEAGVLALAGMRKEAMAAYRRGIARYPERIDTYLLLSNIQKALGRHARSAGMFQYLAATAERDDLFTIAIDGILNMRDGRANRGAPDRLVRWARRIVLERVAQRPDKLYLLRLVADLSDELRDTPMAMRALKTAVPVAGEQRTSILRELMAMAKTLTLPPHLRNNPMLVSISQRGGAEPTPPSPELLMIGRRILGQGELVPPQTYIELGTAFLNAGEVGNASQTFSQASQLPEFAELRRDFARAFERAGYPKEALRIYEQILSVENGDPGLITKVGELLEQTGRDPAALGLYRRGLELLLDRSVFLRTGAKQQQADKPQSPFVFSYGQRNTDDWQRHEAWLTQGLLATLDEQTATEYLREQRRQIAADLERLAAERKSERVAADAQLVHLPRLDRRVTLFRRVAAAFGRIDPVDELDPVLLAAFPGDGVLLENAVRFRLTWGFVVSARKLIEGSTRPQVERKKLRLLAGGTGDTSGGILTAAEAAGLLLPILVDGERDKARAVLERMNLELAEAALEHMPLLVGAAVFLRDADLTLTLCRHWLDVALKHQPATVYMTVESVFKQGRKTLDKSQLRSLTEHVVTRVIDEPDQFSVFLRRLPKLRDQTGPDFLTREQIEKLIKSRLASSDRFVYGLEDLFGLLPEADRSAVLRTVWGQVTKSQRAYFLLRLVSVLDNEFDQGFADFLGSAFDQALPEADDTRILGYQAESLAENAKVNLPLRLRMIEAMVKAGESGLRMQGSLAVLYLGLKRDKDATAAIEKVFAAMFAESGPPRDPMASSAYYRITRELGKDHGDTLIAALDRIEKQRGASVQLTQNRLNLLAQIGRHQEREAALAAAVAKHPEEKSFRTQFISLLESRGEAAAALALRAEDLAKSPKDQGLRRQVITGYRALRHPIKALQVLRDAPEVKAAEDKAVATEAAESGAAAVKKERTPPPTIAEVRKAWDAGDAPAALRTFRRLWRTFRPVDENPYGIVVFRQQNQRLLWPEDPKRKKPAPAGADRPARPRERGGLPELFTRALTAEETERARYRRPRVYYPGQSRTQTGDQPPRSAQSVLAETAAGRQEVVKHLRGMRPTELGGQMARDTYAALAAARLQQDGRAAVVAGLLEQERAGRCSKSDYGILAVLLDDEAGAKSGELAECMRGLTDSLNPRDENQVRRLARLHARAGNPDKASALYRWCALLSATTRAPYFYYQGNEDLLSEVMKNLSGEARLAAVADVLAAEDPGDYNRDSFIAGALQTWMDLLPLDQPGNPERLSTRTRPFLAEATISRVMPNREACKLAAVLHARAGEIDAALRCLEIALCKLPAPEDLLYPFYATYWGQTGHLSDLQALKLFPFDMQGFADPKGWLTRATGEVLAWRKAGRLGESVPLPLLSVLALRLHAHGETDLAARAVEALREVAGAAAPKLLWVADVARLTGDPDTGFAIERELFGKGRLHVERVPGVVARITAGEGNAAGLEAGAQAIAATLHPELLDHLVATAEAAQAGDRVAEWKKLRSDAAAAEQALKEDDRRRAEEAKQKAEAAARAKQADPPR